MEGNYWDQANGHAQPPHPVKFESETTSQAFPYCTEPGLNFSTTNAAYSEDDGDFAGGRRGKTSRQDPLSHRIIEKRRRDRMNLCLADLSRLIPPQYMRKGRGRVEKTEIIEMAIRHLKNLQTQEVLREATFADHYRNGYNDCVTEAAKFLLRERDEELYYKMITHLREHINESMKGEYFKTRCNDTISASSGSPSAYHHPNPPLSQLREMLTTSASDIEHSNNSNDHHDVKDLSFRTNPPQQATAITSTGAAPSNHHMDTSDYDSTRSPTTSSGTTSTTSTRITAANIHHHNHLAANASPPHESVLRTVRMRKLSETSTDVEHCNNNYKFKNYIQQRFTHENYHSEESMQSSLCATENDKDHHHVIVEKKPKGSASPAGIVENGKLNGIHHDIKNELLVVNSSSPAHQPQPAHQPLRNGKLPNGIINGAINGNSTIIPHHSIPIPVFACHTQGFYVPLNIDYEMLLPYLGGIDLLNKNFSHLPPLHPISINVNYTPAHIKNAIASANFIKPKVEGILNGW